MDPKKWGATVWWWLQWLAYQVDTTIHSMRVQGLVDKTATKIQTDMIKSFTSYVNTLGEFLLPCRSCQESTRIFLHHAPSKNILKHFATNNTPVTSIWIFELHNLVNMKLRRPTWTLKQLADLQSSGSFQEFPFENLSYIESCIQYCLPKWPHRKRRFTQAFREFLAPLLLQLAGYSRYNNLTSKQQADAQRVAVKYARL
jgi:hypothetical protein